MTLLDLRTAARTASPSIDERPHDQARAIATWRTRMVNEHGSARVFEGLARQMQSAGVEQPTVNAVLEMAAEEKRHGVLCGAVVDALGGQAIAPALIQPTFPLHPEVGALEAITRNVLSICCLSESVAVALIGAERALMPDGPLRDILTEIWSDEIGHARFGWRWLSTHRHALDAMHLGPYLRVAFAHLEAHELAHLPLGGQADPAFGVCTGADGRSLFYNAVQTVIVPRLEAFGLPAQAAWARRAA